MRRDSAISLLPIRNLLRNSISNKTAIYILIVAGFAVYTNSLFNGFNMDDYGQILDNRLISSLKNVPLVFFNSTFDIGGSITGNYYRPTMMTIFLMLNFVFGQTAFFYHLFSVFLHISNAILAFLFFRLFFTIGLALVLSLFFLVHPINAETVNYISNLQELLFMFFGMITLLIITRKHININFILKACLFAGLSLFSKETGLAFFILATLYQIVYKQGNWKAFVSLYSVILLFYFLLRWIAVGWGSSPMYLMANVSLLTRIINIPQIILYYFKTLIFPKTLTTGYIWIIKTPSLYNVYLPLSILFLLGCVFMIFGFLLYRNKNQQFSLYIFFLVWLAVGMGFHIQIIPLSQTVSDRWFYFPYVGILGILGVLLTSVRKLWSTRIVFVYLALLFVFVLGIRTIYRNNDWRTGLKLAQKDVQNNPNSFMLRNSLGFELSKIGRLDEARIEYEKATQLYPEWGLSWNNLGSVYLKLAKRDNNKEFSEKARENFDKAIEYMPGTVDTPYENKAILMMDYYEPERTKEYLEEIVIKFPNNYKFWILLAVTENKLGNSINAKIAAERSVRINPKCIDCANILRTLRSQQD